MENTAIQDAHVGTEDPTAVEKTEKVLKPVEFAVKFLELAEKSLAKKGGHQVFDEDMFGVRKLEDGKPIPLIQLTTLDVAEKLGLEVKKTKKGNLVNPVSQLRSAIVGHKRLDIDTQKEFTLVDVLRDYLKKKHKTATTWWNEDWAFPKCVRGKSGGRKSKMSTKDALEAEILKIVDAI